MAIVRWWHHFHIIIFLLKPISRDLRWRKLSWLIDSYRVQLQCIVNALRNSPGVHARAPANLRLVTGAARDRIPPAGRRIAIFQSHTHGQSGKYRQLQHLGKPFALVNKTSRNTFLTSVLIGKTPLKALYLKYTQYYTRYFLLTFRNGVALLKRENSTYFVDLSLILYVHYLETKWPINIPTMHCNTHNMAHNALQHP